MRHDWWLVQWATDKVPVAAFPLFSVAVDHVEQAGLRNVEIVRASVTFGAPMVWSVGKGGPWVRTQTGSTD